MVNLTHQDYLTSRPNKNCIEAVSKNVVFEIVADAGHWLQYEQSAVFNEIALQWLKKVGLNPSTG